MNTIGSIRRVEPLLWHGGQVVLFTLLYLGNRFTPHLADDYWMTTIRGLPAGQAAIHAAMTSASRWSTGGGSLSPPFYQTFLMNFPKTLFNCINAALTLLVFRLMHGMLQSPGTQRSLHFYTIVAMTLALAPVPTQTLFWLVGSTAYLWPLCVSLLFMYPFSLTHDGRNTLGHKALAAATPITGVLAGNSHGALSGVAVLVSLLYIVTWQTQKRRVPAWAHAGCLSAIAGCIVMVVAPGNYRRLEAYPSTLSFWKGLGLSIFGIAEDQGVLAAILLTGGLLFRRQEMAKNSPVTTKIIIYGTSALLGLASYLVVSAASRAGLFFTCLATIAVMLMYEGLPQRRAITELKAGILAVLLVAVCVRYSALVYDARLSVGIINERVTYVEAEVARGKTVIEIPSLVDFEPYRRFTGFLPDVRESPDAVENRGVAKYFGAEKIVGRPFRWK